MKKQLFMLALPLMVAVGISTSHGQGLMTMAPGTKIERVASIGNKQVPLPDGVWELVYSGSSRPRSLEFGEALLVRKSDGKGVGFVLVRTNLEPGKGRGWNRPRYCDRNDVHHNGSDSNYNKEDADCWILNHFVAQNRMRSSFLRKFRDYVRQNAGTSTLVRNWYWRNDYSDFLSVSHFVNPTAYGLPADREKLWAESDWHEASVDDASPRGKFIEAAKKFGEKYRDAVRRGLQNKLGGGAPGLKFSFRQ